MPSDLVRGDRGIVELVPELIDCAEALQEAVAQHYGVDSGEFVRVVERPLIELFLHSDDPPTKLREWKALLPKQAWHALVLSLLAEAVKYLKEYEERARPLA